MTAIRECAYRQLRASICQNFGGYTFKEIDKLTCDELLEVAAGAHWINEQIEQEAKKKSKKKG